MARQRKQRPEPPDPGRINDPEEWTTGDEPMTGAQESYLNTLARAWNKANSEPGYDTMVDYDGDGYVGPDDLAIFVEQFGHQQPGCP